MTGEPLSLGVYPLIQLAKKATIPTKSKKKNKIVRPRARLPHNGAVTQNHDHPITLVSFKTKNVKKSKNIGGARLMLMCPFSMDVTILSCGYRESNSGFFLGKEVRYHYNIPAWRGPDGSHVF